MVGIFFLRTQLDCKFTSSSHHAVANAWHARFRCVVVCGKVTHLERKIPAMLTSRLPPSLLDHPLTRATPPARFPFPFPFHSIARARFLLPRCHTPNKNEAHATLCCFRANGTPSVAAFDGSHSTASSPFCLFVMLASSSIPPHPGTGTIHGSIVPSSLRRKGWWAVAWTGRGWMVEARERLFCPPVLFLPRLIMRGLGL